MGYDDIITHLGDFGRYQKRIYFLISLPAIPCSFHKLAGVFLLAKADHRCLLPFEDETTAEYHLPEHILEMSYPKDTLKSTWSSCQYLDANYTEEYLNGTIPATNAVSCNKWIYDHSVYQNSAVMEWDMVCGQSWMKATSDALLMLGVLLGSIGFGILSDKYGRKPIFFASLVIQVLFGVLTGLAPEYITFCISRLIVGASTSGVFLVAYVIAMEMVGPSQRLFAGVAVHLISCIGYLSIAVFAYYITDWRWLQIVLSVPGIVFLSYYWYIPESARWLLSKNRKQAAIDIIKKAAKENKVTISDDVLDNLLDDVDEKKNGNENEPSSSMFDLLRYPNLRKKTLLIFFDWFVTSGTYYGLSWNTSDLGGNDVLNFFIAGAVEIPGYSLLFLTLNRWGRRNTLCGSMLFAGVMLLLTIIVPPHINWLIVALAMLGKFAITSSYGTTYIFSAEQFPTVVRNLGIGASSTCARIGGILVPYCILLGNFWKPLPLIIFGVFSLLGGFLSLLLPETLNKPLLETIEDGEQFGRRKTKSEKIEDEIKL